MSQTYTLIAVSGLLIALALLLFFYRAEARESPRTDHRKPLPGKYFIVILLTTTFLSMAITEWQGVCSLSPWGFFAGIVLGLAAELIAFRRSKGKPLTGSGP